MHPIEQAIEDLRAGKMIIVTDDELRENEGDLIMVAEKVTPDAINFMIKQGGGLICLAMSGAKIDALALPFMTADRDPHDFSTAFTLSIDARYGITTGISAADRARTIRVAASPEASAADIVTSGHVMPIRARDNGVLERPGHTEAAVDLSRLAGFEAAGAICEIVASDGDMLRGKALQAFALEHGLTLISIKQLIEYRRAHDPMAKLVTPQVHAQQVVKTASCQLSTALGTFTLHVFRDGSTQVEHIALVHGEITSTADPLVRLHSSCLTGDILGSLHCDCGGQLHTALEKIVAEPCGVLIYLDQEGRGLGLTNKVRAYALQQQGYDTVSANLELGLPADARDYAVAADILRQLGIKKMRLLTNNPQKLTTLARLLEQDITRVPHQMPLQQECQHYLRAKRDYLGHWLELEAEKNEKDDDVK
jgi:3,4-dihydroxy 2-butanone 4-phosphate synthase/GTP cyclohydrolase II